MTRRIRIGFAAVLVGLAFARPVHACSCGWPPSARQSLIEAAAVLREIGPAAAEAAPALLDALTQGRLDERAGIEAIAAIGSIEAAPALARAMRSSEREDVRRIARSGLEAMRMDPDAVEVAGDRPAPE